MSNFADAGDGHSVESLENFPKIIGRSKSYTENGSAIARSSDRDLDEYTGRHNGFRWMVEAENRRLLRALNLPEWDVWRYGTFTGLSPFERVRVNTTEELEAHYRSVHQKRENMWLRNKALLDYGGWF